MPGNNDPIYSRRGVQGTNSGTTMSQAVTAAANDFTGAHANHALVFTADATNGSFLQRIRLKPAGTNVASCARFFINNGSTQTTAANNTYFDDISLPATTASAVSGTIPLDVSFGFALQPGFRVYMGLATAVAAGWFATAIAGDY